jgi:hypothetical protein
MPNQARTYIGIVVAAGVAVLATALLQWQTADLSRFAAYLALTACVSTLKLKLPGLKGTMTPGFVLVLVGAGTLSWPETAVLCGAAALVQSLWRPKKAPCAAQVAFNCANLIACGSLACWISQLAASDSPGQALLVRLAIALVVLFSSNVASVSLVVCLVERLPLNGVWRLCNYWSFPYYFVGAFVAGLLLQAAAIGVITSLLVAPLFGFFHVHYRELLVGAKG